MIVRKIAQKRKKTKRRRNDSRIHFSNGWRTGWFTMVFSFGGLCCLGIRKENRILGVLVEPECGFHDHDHDNEDSFGELEKKLS